MSVTSRIGREREHVAVVANVKFADRKVLKPLCHLVLIKQHNGVAAVLRFASEKGRVLFTLFGLGEIPITAFLIRYARIGLFYTSEHFLIKVIGKTSVLAHKRLSIFIIVLKIFDYLRIFLVIAVTQPKIIVCDLVTVNFQYSGNFLCNGCFHICLSDNYGIANDNNNKQKGDAD